MDAGALQKTRQESKIRFLILHRHCLSLQRPGKPKLYIRYACLIKDLQDHVADFLGIKGPTRAAILQSIQARHDSQPIQTLRAGSIDLFDAFDHSDYGSSSSNRDANG